MGKASCLNRKEKSKIVIPKAVRGYIHSHPSNSCESAVNMNIGNYLFFDFFFQRACRGGIDCKNNSLYPQIYSYPGLVHCSGVNLQQA